ncbi:hypothetical protein [Mesorhizobium sp.]|uniref:hypothetical protein n=1 Tax=Mesorhizobium sp. TaxID=1871066 RepID=UPI00344BBF87
MACRISKWLRGEASEGRYGLTPGRLHRMSFSGELAYEIYIPAKSGRKVWEALIAAGPTHSLKPYSL